MWFNLFMFNRSKSIISWFHSNMPKKTLGLQYKVFYIWYRNKGSHVLSGRVPGLLLLLKSVRSFFARSNRFRWDGWKLLGSIFTWKRDDDDPFCSLADKNYIHSGWWLRFWGHFLSKEAKCITWCVKRYKVSQKYWSTMMKLASRHFISYFQVYYSKCLTSGLSTTKNTHIPVKCRLQYFFGSPQRLVFVHLSW